MTSKNVLILLGVVVALMGVLALVPAAKDYFKVNDPAWHAVAKIVVGALAVYVAFNDKKEHAE